MTARDIQTDSVQFYFISDVSNLHLVEFGYGTYSNSRSTPRSGNATTSPLCHDFTNRNALLPRAEIL